MNRNNWIDYTASFKPMFPCHGQEAHVMYSFDRPAYIFWSAFMNGLLDSGMTEADAIKYLQSKNTRHLLDGDLSDEIERLAYETARSIKHEE